MSSFRYGGTGNVIEDTANTAQTSQFDAPSSGDMFRSFATGKVKDFAVKETGLAIKGALATQPFATAGAGITSLNTAGNAYSTGIRAAGLPVVDTLATTAGTTQGISAASAGSNFASGLATAGIGFAAGKVAAPIASHIWGHDNNSGVGASTGAAAGAAIGSVVPVLGTALGAVLGGVLGGLAGSLFGGTKRSWLWVEQGSNGGDNTDDNWNSGKWDKTVDTSLGKVYIEGKRTGNDAVKPIADMFEAADAYVASLLTPEQLEAAKGYIENNPIEGARSKWKSTNRAQKVAMIAVNRRYSAAMMSVDSELSGIFSRHFEPETFPQTFSDLIAINNDFKASSRLFTDSGVSTGNAAIDHIGQMMGLERPEGEKEQIEYEKTVLATFTKDRRFKQMKDETSQTYQRGQAQMAQEVAAGTRRGMPTRPDGTRGLLQRGVA